MTAGKPKPGDESTTTEQVAAETPAEAPAERTVVVLEGDRVQVGAGVWPLSHAIRLGLVAPGFAPEG